MTQPLKSFMAVATFRDRVTPEDIRALVPAEQARVAVLKEQGLVGEIKVAMPRRTVFIEFFDETEDAARINLDALPLAELWTSELFETTPPAGASL